MGNNAMAPKIDYTPPNLDDVFICLACCCEACSLKQFECSSIQEQDCLCIHGISACELTEIKVCVKSTGACLCLDTRCAIPCDEDMPCMVALCNVKLYDSRK